MPLELNGAQVLQTVLDKPHAFPVIHGELSRLAQSLMMKQLRQRSLGIEGLRAVETALGRETMLLVIDAMSDAEVKSLVVRMDPHYEGLRDADPAWQRGHLLQLSEGERDPQPKGGAPEPVPEPGARRTMTSRAMAAIARPRDDLPERAAVDEKAKGKAEAKGKGKGKDKAEPKGKKKKGKG
ncbi:MAG: hypothetical protein AAFY02_13985 [Pseudomonadota bacterium]